MFSGHRGHRVDQAARLRELVGSVRRRPLTIAIVSGKGGVGKSNIAVNLAVLLSLRGARATLVDLDMGLANADLLMNIQPRYTLSDFLSGHRSLEEVVTAGPGGIRFLPGVSGVDELADLSEFERQNLLSQLQALETNTDIIVLDCGAGIGRNVTTFAMAADRVVVVTTPQPTALTDGYAMIKALRRKEYASTLCLVVNMANSRSEAAEARRRIVSVAKRFLNYSVADLGYMLHDTVVAQAVRERCPFVIRHPGSGASACVAAMAGEISRAFAGHNSRGGFFRRVAGLFV